jgi:hypothetical protein
VSRVGDAQSGQVGLVLGVFGKSPIERLHEAIYPTLVENLTNLSNSSDPPQPPPVIFI